MGDSERRGTRMAASLASMVSAPGKRVTGRERAEGMCRFIEGSGAAGSTGGSKAKENEAEKGKKEKNGKKVIDFIPLLAQLRVMVSNLLNDSRVSTLGF